jgi:hypothetical protein
MIKFTQFNSDKVRAVFLEHCHIFPYAAPFAGHRSQKVFYRMSSPPLVLMERKA